MMVRTIICPALLVAVILCGPVEAADSRPAAAASTALLRLAIVDASSSMEGERLDVARSELLRVARQLPPSKSHPFVIVPFDSTSRQVQTFTDLPSMEAFLSNLTADGGTSIAAGLARAVKELSRYAGARNVCVFLYTDGEDRSEKEIAAQEARLDALFADRQTKGLEQTVVFCKRWQRANARLVKRITERSRARVIDAGELNLVPVTLQPKVTVRNARWLADAPSTLEISLDASIRVLGKKDGPALTPLLLKCTSPRAKGDLRTPIPPGNVNATPLTIRLPVAPDTIVSGGPLELEFELAEPQTSTSDDGLVLPLLALDRITVPVDLPQAGFHSVIRASVEQSEPGKWLDPFDLRAAFPLRIELEVTSVDGKPWSQPVAFRIVAESTSGLVEGNDTLLIGGPGRYEAIVTMSATPQDLKSPVDLPEIPVAFRIVPQNVPPNVQFNPPELRIGQGFPAPPPVDTTISARFLKATPPQWVDVLHGVAIFQADFAVSVAGPLSPGAELVLRCPPAVRDVAIEPSVLRAGDQTVQLTLWAKLPPAPTEEELVFRILPPPGRGAVRFDAPDPASCRVIGPRPAQLALTDGKRILFPLRATVRDARRSTRIRVVPVALHLSGPRAAQGLTCTLTSQGPVTVNSPASLPVHAACDLAIGVGTPTSASFFRDATIAGTITVAPPAGAAAAVGSRQPIHVRIEAPFKRLVFYLAVSISLVIAAFLIGRMVIKLTPANRAAP